MRGLGHLDAIESVTFRHGEGNEGAKNGVEMGIRAFYGAKLLKRKAGCNILHRIKVT
jgi:hypothetical protein